MTGGTATTFESNIATTSDSIGPRKKAERFRAAGRDRVEHGSDSPPDFFDLVARAGIREEAQVQLGGTKSEFETILTGRTPAWLIVGEHFVEQLVRDFAHLQREVVDAIGMLDAQPIFVAEELEDGAGGCGDPVHAVGAEVRVLRRRDDEHFPRRERLGPRRGKVRLQSL